MIYFSEFFDLNESVIDEYGALNISLVNDLPLFIDPFLLFGSNKPEYQLLHTSILDYLSFLKEKSEEGDISEGEILAWYKFPEVKQNWLGYSVVGNSGRGLGLKFGRTLSATMPIIFPDLRNETITLSSHLEKAGLFQVGIGKDNISDFSCNLIKCFLLNYTQEFAKKYINPKKLREVSIQKVYFDYNLERWSPQTFTLPYIFGDYVLLTPRDILTKDDTWINSHDLHHNFDKICNTIPNAELRAQINNYFTKVLPKHPKRKKPTQRETSQAIVNTLTKFPKIIDYYIKGKEINKEGAVNASKNKVTDAENLFIRNVEKLVSTLTNDTQFYSIPAVSSYSEAMQRIVFLKDVIENKDGYRIFYVKGNPIKREADLQIIYRLTWYSTEYDVNREVNNGRGPVDFKISKGSKDVTLVEFKLASNTQLKKNLQNQVEVYKKANNTNNSITAILYFDRYELQSVLTILKELKLENDNSIILIDARSDNKISASKVSTTN